MPKTIDERHPSIGQAMRGLRYQHLATGPLRDFSARFWCLAVEAVEQIETDDPELTVAIRKLVEAKDAFVRARVFSMVATGQPKPVNTTNPDGSLKTS